MPMDRMEALFAQGVKVLLVDDDATCLKIIERMLQCCKYDVTCCSEPKGALDLLFKEKVHFDLVMTDVGMPGIDGFQLLDRIRLELNLPVIMMSADNHFETMVKGMAGGATFYMTKPLKMEMLASLWQHVVRVNEDKLLDASKILTMGYEGKLKDIQMEGYKNVDNKDTGKKDTGNKDIRNKDVGHEGPSLNIDDHSKKRREDEMASEAADNIIEENDDTTTKKRRILWTTELHEKFIKAVNRIGIHRVVPKKILEIIDAPGLTRENVASHLQKYRIYLKRVEEANLYAAIGSKPPNRVPLKSIFASIPPQVNPFNKSFQSPFFTQQTHYFDTQASSSSYQGNTFSNLSRPMNMMTPMDTQGPNITMNISQTQQVPHANEPQMMRNFAKDPLLTAMTAFTHDGVPDNCNQIMTTKEQPIIQNNFLPPNGMSLFNNNTTQDFGQIYNTMASAGFPGNSKKTMETLDGNVMGNLPDGNNLQGNMPVGNNNMMKNLSTGNNQGFGNIPSGNNLMGNVSSENSSGKPLLEYNNSIMTQGVEDFGTANNVNSEIGTKAMKGSDQTGNDKITFNNSANGDELDQSFYEAIQGFIQTTDNVGLDDIFQMQREVENTVNELEKELMDEVH